MERLTIKVDELFAPKKLCTVNRYEEVDDCDSCIDCCKQHGKGSNTCNGCPVQECFDRLGVYENLDEQGLILKLPCKVGTAFYEVIDDCTYDGDCHTKRMCGTCRYRDVHIELDVFSTALEIIEHLEEFGKTVFLTREEALEKMAE